MRWRWLSQSAGAEKIHWFNLKSAGLKLRQQKIKSSAVNVKVCQFFRPQRQKESNKATIFVSRW